VQGSGIPLNSWVTSINNSTHSITVSQAATSAVTSDSLTFGYEEYNTTTQFFGGPTQYTAGQLPASVPGQAAAVSASSGAWLAFVNVLSGYTAGTDSSGNAISNPSNLSTVQADGEGLKNALAAFNHSLSGTAGFVLSPDGGWIGWQDSLGSPVYDVHPN